MSTIDNWQYINRELISICETLCERLSQRINFDVSARIAHAFVLKATRTLKGVTILYDNGLWEQAQSLVRILIELRLNFDFFLHTLTKDAHLACQRVIDSMMLEKIKQQRASNFAGIELSPSGLSRDDLEKLEREISLRYSPKELERLKKHGFTGVPIEQRAKLTEHEEVYDIIYRNFSRNIHSTDYLEHFMLQESRDSKEFREYYESRDSISLYAAHFSAGGIAEFANHAYKCGLDSELDEIGKKQEALRSMDKKTKKNQRNIE